MVAAEHLVLLRLEANARRPIIKEVVPEMLCPHCNVDGGLGSFCTACGGALAVDEATKVESAALNAPRRSHLKAALIGGGVAVVLLIGAVVAYLVLRPSPAIPYLEAICQDVSGVDFTKKSTEENEDLLSSVESDLEQAMAKDAELARPFQDIEKRLADIVTYNKDLDRQIAAYDVWASDYLLAQALISARNINTASTELVTQVDSVCTVYNES